MPSVARPTLGYYAAQLGNFSFKSKNLKRTPPTSRQTSLDADADALEPPQKVRKTSSFSAAVRRFKNRFDSVTEPDHVAMQIALAERERNNSNRNQDTSEARAQGVANLPGVNAYLNKRRRADGPSGFYNNDSFCHSGTLPSPPHSLNERFTSPELRGDRSRSRTSLGNTRFPHYQRHSTHSPDPAELRGRTLERPGFFGTISSLLPGGRRREKRRGKQPATLSHSDDQQPYHDSRSTPHNVVAAMTPILTPHPKPAGPRPAPQPLHISTPTHSPDSATLHVHFASAIDIETYSPRPRLARVPTGRPDLRAPSWLQDDDYLESFRPLPTPPLRPRMQHHLSSMSHLSLGPRAHTPVTSEHMPFPMSPTDSQQDLSNGMPTINTETVDATRRQGQVFPDTFSLANGMGNRWSLTYDNYPLEQPSIRVVGRSPSPRASPSSMTVEVEGRSAEEDGGVGDGSGGVTSPMSIAGNGVGELRSGSGSGSGSSGRRSSAMEWSGAEQRLARWDEASKLLDGYF